MHGSDAADIQENITAYLLENAVPASDSLSNNGIYYCQYNRLFRRNAELLFAVK